MTSFNYLVPTYGGTRAYVLNFTQGLKQQLAETNIRFQYAAPASTVSEIWDVMRIPMSSLSEDVLMDTEACVDMALKGLDDGKLITTPSVHDESQVKRYADSNNDNTLPNYIYSDKSHFLSLQEHYFSAACFLSPLP